MQIVPVRIYPNPTRNSSILEIGEDYNELSFTVYDVDNKIIKHKKHTNNIRLIQLEFMKNEPNGFYLVDVNIGGVNKKLTLIKII